MLNLISDQLSFWRKSKISGGGKYENNITFGGGKVDTRKVNSIIHRVAQDGLNCQLSTNEINILEQKAIGVTAHTMCGEHIFDFNIHSTYYRVRIVWHKFIYNCVVIYECPVLSVGSSADEYMHIVIFDKRNWKHMMRVFIPVFLQDTFVRHTYATTNRVGLFIKSNRLRN